MTEILAATIAWLVVLVVGFLLTHYGDKVVTRVGDHHARQPVGSMRATAVDLLGLLTFIAMMLGGIALMVGGTIGYVTWLGHR